MQIEIVDMTGPSYPPVRAAIDLYEAGGWSAIRPARRGRLRGDGRVLSQAQEEAIQRLIIDQRPEQLKMDFHLWSRAAVMQLIEQEFDIKLPVRSVGKYLTRWGFTPQKPIKRPTSKAPQRCRLGWRANTPPLSSALGLRARKSTGETRRRWSTRTCAAEALPRQAKPRWRWPWAGRATSSR